MGKKEKIMSEYDVRFAAYERMMKRNGNFGMKGDQLRQYYGDYSTRLQDALNAKDDKIASKQLGKEEARRIAKERAAAKASRSLHTPLKNSGLVPANFNVNYGTAQQLRALAPTGNIMPQAPTEHISLNRNIRDIQKQQRKLYKESIKGQANTPMANRFSVDGRYFIQYPDGTIKEFPTQKDQVKEFKRMMKKDGIMFDPNAKVPEGFDPANPNGKVKPDPVKPDPVKPDPVKPDPVKPDPVKPDPVKPDPVKPDPVNPDPVQPEGNKKVKPSRQERLKKIRNNPEARARYNNLKLRNNPELKARYDSMKAFKKAGKWKKAGKIGAIIAGAAALIGGAIALFGGKDKKADGAGAVPVVPPTDETQQPAEPAAPATEPVDEAPAQPAAPVTEPAPADETPAQPTAPVESQEPAALEEKEIEAVIGDNYWKYAKQELIAEHQGEADYKPTDKEILKRTLEIMDRNGVKLAEDGIHSDPMLKVGDKVKIKVAA